MNSMHGFFPFIFVFFLDRQGTLLILELCSDTTKNVVGMRWKMPTFGHQYLLKPGPTAILVPLLPYKGIIKQEPYRNRRCDNTASRCLELGLSSSEGLWREHLLRDGYSECTRKVDEEHAGRPALDGELGCPSAEGTANLSETSACSSLHRVMRYKALVLLRGRR